MDMRRAAMIFGGLALVGVGATLTIRTARRLLRKRPEAATQDGLIGRHCRVTTLEVTETFGQASLEDGGAGLILSVRCTTPNELARGQMARIVAYNADAGTYEVAVTEGAAA